MLRGNQVVRLEVHIRRRQKFTPYCVEVHYFVRSPFYKSIFWKFTIYLILVRQEVHMHRLGKFTAI
jgi:hypothetical protein